MDWLYEMSHQPTLGNFSTLQTGGGFSGPLRPVGKALSLSACTGDAERADTPLTPVPESTPAEDCAIPEPTPEAVEAALEEIHGKEAGTEDSDRVYYQEYSFCQEEMALTIGHNHMTGRWTLSDGRGAGWRRRPFPAGREISLGRAGRAAGISIFRGRIWNLMGQPSPRLGRSGGGGRGSCPGVVSRTAHPPGGNCLSVQRYPLPAGLRFRTVEGPAIASG